MFSLFFPSLWGKKPHLQAMRCPSPHNSPLEHLLPVQWQSLQKEGWRAVATDPVVRMWLSTPAAQGWTWAMGLVGAERASAGTVGAWGDMYALKTLCISRTELLIPWAGLVPPRFVSAQIWSDSAEVNGKRKTCEAEISSQRAWAASGSSEAGKVSFTQGGVDSFIRFCS